MTTVPDYVLNATGSVLMQECVRNFLDREDLQLRAPFEGEVRRFVPRQYLPMFSQWRSAMAVLAQDYFVLLGLARDRVEVCICVSSITDVAVHEYPGTADQVDLEPRSAASSPGFVAPNGGWSPENMSTASSPGLRSRSHRNKSARPLPPGTFRITYFAGSRQRRLLLWAENRREWARTISDALLSRRIGEPIFRTFVPIEDVRAWALQAAGVSAPNGNGSLATTRSSHTNVTLGLGVVSLLVKCLERSAMHSAMAVLKFRMRRARLQCAGAATIGACLAGIVRRVTHSEVFLTWRRLIPSVALQYQQSSAEAFAQALVEAWDPLWAPRVIIMQKALLRPLHAAFEASWRRLRATALARRATVANGVLVLTQDSHRPTPMSITCSKCMVLAIQRCIKRRLGHALRILACAGAREGLTGARDAFEVRPPDAEDCMHDELPEQTAYVHCTA